MKHFAVFLLIFLTGCHNRSESPSSESITEPINPIENYVAVIDSTFNDFIAYFGYKPEVQKSRTKFPIECDSLGVIFNIQKDSWINDRLFFDLESTTFISNGLENDEKSIERVFTWINTQTGICNNYYFKKDQTKWYLVKKSITNELSVQDKEDFYSFLSRFCSDSIFQKQRVSFPIDITYLDDDFNSITVTRNDKEWKFQGFYFNSDSLAIYFYDFQRTFKDTDDRVLDTRGNDNGISARITFKRIGNKWFLTRLEDHST